MHSTEPQTIPWQSAATLVGYGPANISTLRDCVRIWRDLAADDRPAGLVHIPEGALGKTILTPADLAPLAACAG